MNWQQSWADGASFTSFSGVQFIDADHGFATLDGEVGQPSLLETVDGGRTWSVVLKDLRLARLGRRAAVTFFDGLRGVAFAGEAGDPDEIWVTNEAGREWVRARTPLLGAVLNDFAYVAGGNRIVGVGEGGLVIRSDDGGTTWPARQKLGPRLNAVNFFGAGQADSASGIAVGAGGTAYYTENGGETWEPGAVPPGLSNDVNLIDVAVATDGGAPGAPTVAVAVGANSSAPPTGVLLYSTDSGKNWQAFGPLGEAGAPNLSGVSLASVALADTEPATPGGIVGYAVGGGGYHQNTGFPLVLEMQGDPGTWAAAAVDPRFSAFSASAIQRTYSLDYVAVDPSGVTAMAAGRRLLLDRLSGGELPSLADDEWWRCVPPQPSGDSAVDEAIRTAAESLEPENEDDPGVRVCHERAEATTSPNQGNFGPTDAKPCQLENPTADHRFPCVATWEPLAGFTADGKPEEVKVPQTLFFDDDIGGAGRRLVAVDHEHVFLFDPDRLQQRGVPGFGKGFGGTSQYGTDTGVVKLRQAPGYPAGAGLGLRPSLRAYDDSGDRVYLASFTARPSQRGVAPVIATLSLTGEFAPTVTEVPPLLDTQGRTNAAITHMAFDSRFGMLYVLTESNHRRDQVFAAPTMVDSSQVTMRAYSTRASEGGEPTGELELAWVLPLEARGCRSTYNLEAFMVSAQGDALSFGCAGHAGPHFGMPSLEPNRVMTVRLRLSGRHPTALDPTRSSDVVVTAEAIAGKVFNEDKVALGAQARNTLAWNQTADGANLWDFDVGGWIGTIPYPGIGGVAGMGLDAPHPWRGRLYVSCQNCVDFASDNQGIPKSALLVADTLNVPAQVPAAVTQEVELPVGAGFPPAATDSTRSGHILAVVPPRGPDGLPRLFYNDDDNDAQGPDGEALHLFEDRVAPSLERVSPNPDDRTFPEVDEADAGDVKRIGRASAYGSRLWWKGLGSATTPACQHGIGNQVPNLTDPCGSPTLSYDWMTDNESITGGPGGVRFGAHTSAVPGLPGAGSREMRLGEVQQANLENNKLSQLSDAKAVALRYDGGPADDARGTTGDDLSRRRGSDAHLLADAEIAQFCDTVSDLLFDNEDAHEQCEGPHSQFESQFHDEFDRQFGPYEIAIEELGDRVMSEVDGQRSVNGECGGQEDDDPRTPWDEREAGSEADCFEDLDTNDPRDHPLLSPMDRRSAAERAEVVFASQCLEPAGREEDFLGSQTRCRVGDFGHTEARAELNGLEVATQGGVASSVTLDGVSVGSTGSHADIFFRDPELGIVVETEAWAQDVELRLGAHGSLGIGEVRSMARAYANGRPEHAQSSLDVSFTDVVISGPDGDPRFSCGRSEPGVNRLSGDPDDLPSEDECDPHEVVDAISAVFGARVQATTSARDTDPKVVGSPGGAQAMVRRNPVDVLSDQVINRIPRHFELPALQLTIFNDGLRPNRMQIDLAAVYAETHYEIGLPVEQIPPEPGSIEVNLADRSGQPLPGGTFAVLIDGDQDGEVSAGDTAVGECTTDATGSCEFEGLDEGAYLVEQRAAPLGFMAEATAREVFVSEGGRETVEFVNGPDSSAVVVELVDPAGNPLGGGGFALVPDPDGDGAVGVSDSVSAGCITGGDGKCRFDHVSPASWVLHQTAAPRGYQTADDVAFALPEPGLVAEIRVVNGPAVSGRIVEIIDGVQPVSSTEGGPPWWGMVPKSLAALLLRGWVQALLFALTGALFGAPAYLAHRRRELAMAKHLR